MGARAQRPTVQISQNPRSGRDFVVGDVHGEFPTLERLLERVAFTPGDRLFALGDLVDRGPQSADALAWFESGRITLSVRGNHEQMLLEKLDSAEREGRLPWTTPQWFVDEIPPADWPRWSEAIWKLPIAATVRTAAGPVGLVHAAPTARHWERMCTRIEDGHGDTIWLAMNSTARTRGDAQRVQCPSPPPTAVPLATNPFPAQTDGLQFPRVWPAFIRKPLTCRPPAIKVRRERATLPILGLSSRCSFRHSVPLSRVGIRQHAALRGPRVASVANRKISIEPE